jgi:hypothetical protein
LVEEACPVYTKKPGRKSDLLPAAGWNECRIRKNWKTPLQARRRDYALVEKTQVDLVSPKDDHLNSHQDRDKKSGQLMWLGA